MCQQRKKHFGSPCVIADGVPFTNHNGGGVTGRLGVRRKVCFTDKTRFRDSTEGVCDGQFWFVCERVNLEELKACKESFGLVKGEGCLSFMGWILPHA